MTPEEILTELETIRRYLIGGMSEREIAAILQRSRSYVQRRRWILQLGVEEEAASGKLTDTDLLALKRAEADDKLAETLAAFRASEKLESPYRTRTYSEIKSVLGGFLTRQARQALEWAILLREEPNEPR